MSPQSIFYLLIGIISVKFLFDTYVNYLNSKHFKDEIPEELNGIYDENEYHKSQAYKYSNYRFGLYTSIFNGFTLSDLR